MTSHESETVDRFRRNVLRRIDQGGLSISEVARQSKMDRSSLSDVLHGHGGITLAKAANVARALGTDLSDLLKDEDL